MKKMMIILVMLAIMLSMTACGEKTETSANTADDTATTETVESEPAPIEPDEDISTETSEDIATEPAEKEEFVKMYELSNIEYVKENGETQQADFIPGSEVYIFKEGEGYQNFEYRYKNYASYDEMLNDSNYTIKSVNGSYTLNSDHTQLALVGEDGSFRYAEVSGDKITFEYSQEGYDVKMVTTYTETDKVSI